MRKFLGFLLTCFMVFSTLTGGNVLQAGGYRASVRGCYSNCSPLIQQQVVYRDRFIYTPQVQQYVAVPVQPYYASWNAAYGTVPAYSANPTLQGDVGQQIARQQQMQQQQMMANTATDPRNESAYLTRQEFLAAMQDIVQAMREGGEGSAGPVTPGVSPKIAAMVKTHCSSCHSADDPRGTWPDTREPVILWNRDRLADNINWDRVGIVTLVGKMPKDGKLTQQEINDFIHHSATFAAGRAGGSQTGPAAAPPPPAPDGANPANGGIPAQPTEPEHNY